MNMKKQYEVTSSSVTGRPSTSKPTAWLIRSSPGCTRRSAMTARK